ncbi:MAG: hypothetical protein KJ556_21650 [Gammaproteobacteria bacterium]|nr:hypothetical protein [Gammaproteobacteria bacterium]
MTYVFNVWIPFLPPGINQQYGRSKIGRVYLKPGARVWKSHAAIVVGARAGLIDWKDCDKPFSIKIYVVGSKSDADAYIKTVIDTVCTKLGFDDKRIASQSSEKCKLQFVRDMYCSEEIERIKKEKENRIAMGPEGDDYFKEYITSVYDKNMEVFLQKMNDTKTIDGIKQGVYVKLFPAEEI